MMIPRRLIQTVIDRLEQFPAVALLGPRQVGKTTIALEIAKNSNALYLDLELPEDRNKLSDPALYFKGYEDRLVILDEIHRLPEIFQILRGVIDQGLRNGHNSNRFLLLGSASIDLLKQSGESLAGRIAYLELSPLDILEIDLEQCEQLWVRGGFPKSFIAANDSKSVIWRDNFIRTYLERDIPQLGPRIPAETLRRFWTMLAHLQGSLVNASHIARGLAVDSKTIARYLDLMVDLLLVRRLMPYHINIGKRLVKSPKVYVRDSGVLHALLKIDSYENLLGSPVAGLSWEGFVIETLLRVAPERTLPSFYRTVSGAEIDLLLELPGKRNLWAIEIKRSLTARPGKGFYHACDDVKPSRAFVVYAGNERYPVSKDIDAIALSDMAELLLTHSKNKMN